MAISALHLLFGLVLRARAYPAQRLYNLLSQPGISRAAATPPTTSQPTSLPAPPHPTIIRQPTPLPNPLATHAGSSSLQEYFENLNVSLPNSNGAFLSGLGAATPQPTPFHPPSSPTLLTSSLLATHAGGSSQQEFFENLNIPLSNSNGALLSGLGANIPGLGGAQQQAGGGSGLFGSGLGFLLGNLGSRWVWSARFDAVSLHPTPQ